MPKSKSKILFILTLPPPLHGANITNKELWESKVRQAFDCVLLDISDIRDINNMGKLDFVNVKLALKSLFNLFRLLRKQRFDLVYILSSQNNLGFFRDGLFILLVKTLSRKSKIVIHLHGSYFKSFYLATNWFMQRFIDFTLRKVDSAIVLGEALKVIFSDWIKDVHVVPNGTDVLLSGNGNGRVHKSRMPANGQVTILFLSNLKKFKGILDVIKSAVDVCKRYPQVVYKIAGTWGHDIFSDVSPDELKEEVMEIIRTNGLENAIQFLGFVTGQAKEDLLLDAHIFVLPSHCEGHPRAIIEAMAASCPVISTRIGAIPDTVIEEETGFLIEPQSPEMLTDRIVRLIEDRSLREKMGKAARERYEKLYTKEQFIEHMIDVFENILSK